MATPKKLPSGNYRIQVYHYTDVHGRKHYKSFTAPSRKQVILLAAEWEAKRVEEEKPENITVYEAIGKYLDIKKGVLSPSTMTGYQSMRESYFTGVLGRTKLLELENIKIQIWIGELSEKVTPKTVRNAHGLLSAVLEMFYPDFRLKTTLPAKKKPDLYTPNDKDIKKLLLHIQGKELEIAVLLAAFGTMRRGEICALTSEDIQGNFINVNKSMVQGPDKAWYIKQPKTYGSYRRVEMPDFVIKRIQGIEGRIIKATPNQISDRFKRAVIACDLPHFRFHDLRHYSASIMHAIGVPDQYILQRGGWISDNVMKTVYRNVIDLESVKQSRKINQHFEKISHEISHKA